MRKSLASRARRGAVVAIIALALLATACGRSGSDDASGGGGSSSGSSTEKCTGTTLEATEIGVTSDSITIQVMADVGSPLAPGLFQGNVDAVQAFAKWANANGGVGCRQVKVEVWDSKMDATEGKNGLINGCNTALALVGSNALFNPDVSVLGNCIDKAGQAVGIPNFVGLANDANEQCHKSTWNVQSVAEKCVNGSFGTGVRVMQTNGGYYNWLQKNLGPVKEIYMIPGDLPTTVQSSTYIMASQRKVGIEILDAFKISGRLEQAGYVPVIQAAKQLGANMIYDGSNSAVMLKAQKEAQAQGLTSVKWAGSLSIYNKDYTAAGAITNGTYAGLNQLPWDEAQYSEGLKAYVDNVGGEAKADALGANGFMAAMAFKETVDRIVAEKGANAITRAAILAAMPNTTSDFGGWVGAPKTAKGVMPCFMVVQINDGKWNRVYPEKPGTLDCTDPTNLNEVTLDTATEATKLR